MAIKNIYDTEITASSFTWNGNTIATQAWVNANVGTPTLDAVTTVGNTTTNSIEVGPAFYVGRNISTTSAFAQLGHGRTGSGYAYLDLVGDTTYTDYGLRVIRYNTGANAASDIVHRGTGQLSIISNEAAPILFKTTAAERMRILPAGQVAIGRTTAFTVGGTATLSVNGDLISWGNSSTDLSYFRRLSTGNFQWQTYNGGNAGNIHLQPYGGNVGVGTTSPSRRLDVDGIQGWQLSNLETAYLNPTATGADFALKDQYNANIIRLDSRPSAVSYFNGGNVGIGTTSPAQKLDVNGVIAATGGNSTNWNTAYGWGDHAAAGYLTSYSETDTLDSVTSRGNVTTNNIGVGLIELSGDTEHRLYRATTSLIKGTTTDTTILTGRTLDLYAYDDVNIRAGSSDNISFTAGGVSNAMYINSSGNVGIGTTSPAYKLDIVGDTYTSGKYVSNSGEIISLYQSSWNAGNQNHYVLYNGWRTNTGDYLMIKSSGNQSTGEAAMVLADGNGGGRTYFGTHAAQSQANDNALTPLDSTYAFIGAADTYFSSDVGIGTTSPDAKLAINTAAGQEGIKIRNVNSQDTFHLGHLSTEDSYLQMKNNAGTIEVLLRTDNGNSYINTGNVGIGTTSPGTKLQVDGTLLLGDSYVQPAGSSWTTSNSQLILGGAHNAGFNTGTKAKLVISGYDNDGSTIYPIFVEDENGYADFWIKNRPIAAGASTAFFSGNVGIGTTSPGYTLDVNGSMHSTNITIADAIYHEGDTNTVIGFGTDTINLSTGGGVRATINNSGAKFNNDVVVVGGATLSLGERGEPDDLGRTILLEGAANAANGEGSGRIFFSEHNSTTASADNYGLSLYYEGDPNIALPSGFQPNQGNGTWSLRRHNNSVNGDYIMSGSRTNSDVTFWGNLTVPNTIYHQDDANTYMQFPANDTWIVATSGSERLRVTSAGNVGIGASSPSEKLQVGTGSLDDRIRVYYSDGTYSEQTGWGMEFARNASYLRPNNNNARTLNIGSSGLAWNGVNVESTNFTWNSNAVATQSWVTSQGYSTSSATVYTPDVYEWAQNVYGSNTPIDIGGQMVNGTTTTSQISPSEIQFTAAGTYMISWSLNWESLYNNRSVFGAGAYLNGFIIPGSSNLQYFRYNTYGHASTTNATFSVQVAAGDVISWRTLLHSGAANHATTPIGGDMGAITIHRIA